MDGWTNNHFIVSVLIQFWSVFMQQVKMLDPMENKFKFSLI